MKVKKLFLLAVILLLSMASFKSFAYDVKVANADGVMIYYNYINDGEALEVTSGDDKYTGDVVIPSEVTYMNRSRNVTSIGDFAFSECGDLSSVTIPSGVKSIGESAFEGSSLTSVTIPSSVTSIGRSAFSDIYGLTSVKIPKNVKTIGDEAFAGCWALASVTISNGVKSIGGYAFAFTGLTSVTIPNSVTSIGENAFVGCGALESIKIGTGVSKIGVDAFAECDNLKAVHITDLEAWMKIEYAYNDEWIPSNPLNQAHHLYLNNVEIENLVIPDGITEIKLGAFFGCSGLTSVEIPESVTSIGDWAFQYCGNLPSVTIPNSVKYIGYGAFSGCGGLTSVTIPNNVNEIKGWAFCQCTSLTSVTIPNSLNSIGAYTFWGCSGLTSVEIPNSVTSIEEGAFVDCGSLESIKIGTGVSKIGVNAFAECDNLKAVHISDLEAWLKIEFADNEQWVSSNPLVKAHNLYLNNVLVENLVIPDGITEIKFAAFEECNCINSIEIPNSVTSIGSRAFQNCNGLTSVEIPNSVTSIGWSAFCACRSLTSVTIPNSVTYIGGIAFSDCDNLTSVIIPNSVTEIDYYSFAYCPELTSITIPNSVTSIGEGAFRCSGLTSVTIPSSVTSIGEEAFADTDIATIISMIEDPFEINSNTFNKNTFYNATLLVPEGTVDKYKATPGWNSFKYIDEEVKSIVQNSDLEGNDLSCFYVRENYIETDEIVPATVVDGAGVDNSRGIVVQSIDNPTEGWATQFFVRLTQTLPVGTRYRMSFDYKASQDAYVLMEGHGEPSDYIFWGFGDVDFTTSWQHYECEGTVNEGMSTEEKQMRTIAFDMAIKTATTYYLDNIVFQIDQPHVNIENILFADAHVKALCVANWDTNGDGELSEVEASGVTTLGEVFKNNTEITSFDELNYFRGLTSIDDNAFYGCSSLASVTIPNCVSSIGDWAFSNCAGLTSVAIPGSVTSVGDGAFLGCSNLSVTIPNSVTAIGIGAFKSCGSWPSLLVSDNVTSIGKEAFGETDITTVISKIENPFKISSNTFNNNTYNNATLYVPTGTVNQYKALTGWKSFKNIEEMDINNVRLNKTEVAIAGGKTVTLKATVSPESLPDKSVTWKSSNHVVATVTSSGKVESTGDYGETLIICTSVLTGAQAICKVTVGGVSLDKSEAILEKGKTMTLKATVYPETLADKSVTWKSSNTEVATVTSSGKVKGIKAGKATITCTSVATGAKATCQVTVGYVKLDISEVTLDKGKTVTLTSTVYPSKQTDQSVTWESSDETVATVTSSGKVKGIKAGTATITCASVALGLSTTCKVTVNGVNLDKSEAILEKGKTMTLKPSIYPETLTDKSVTWKSSNTAVATVTSSGKVKGVKAGTATITCTSVATGAKATCQVTVSYVKLDQTEVILEKGKTMTLAPTVYPSKQTDQSVTWKSSNTAVATVTSSGKVKGVKAGTATITCTSVATGLSTTCKVTVSYVRIDPSEAILEKGKTMTLASTVYPSKQTDQSVTWKSSNTEVATVTSSGKVKGVKAGIVTITCTSVATGLSTTCKVTVGYVKLNVSEVTIDKGNTITLTPTVYPSKQTDQSVTWKSSDETVATVTSSGKVTGIKAGTATITCTSDALGLSTTCKVTVTASSNARILDGDDADVTGIEALDENPAVEEPFDVYDLRGHKVLHQVTSLDGLPAGVYIVNGKKVLKK